MDHQHTPEPWELRTFPWGTWFVKGSNSYVVAQGSAGAEPKGDGAADMANTHRIIACVNACAGMEDPATEIARLRSDLSRLRGFAKDIMEYWPDGTPDSADLQEIGAQHGLLEGAQRIVPCGALRCQCADWEAEGEEVTCYHATSLLLAGREEI